jgi:5-methyltetrahydrofolate--homocysteine methyltransferase
MIELNEWRGFDLSTRKAKIEKAFERGEITSPEDVPLLINTPPYFAFGSRQTPEDYFTNPASMVAYQERGYEEHLKKVNDDLVPYFMPWFGTGVLASGFGCQIVTNTGGGDDPAVAGPCITSPADAARLKMPDPHTDGWMPHVLAAIDYARAYSDLPPGLTDMQGPLDTLGLMCGQARLYQWMYQEPRMVHELFDLVTEAFILWTMVQKKHIGEPLNQSYGLQGVGWSASVGIWESDDDLVLLDPGLYREFVVPCLSRIFTVFGGGSVHFCGNGYHHLDNLHEIQGLRVVNHSPMGNFDGFAKFRAGLGPDIVVQIQDSAPIDVETYYAELFNALDDLRGLMLATFVLDEMGMDANGGYLPVTWDPYEIANRVVAACRGAIARKLDGEPTRPDEWPSFVSPDVSQQATTATTRRQFCDEQGALLAAVQECLVDFDRPGLDSAIHVALDAGIAPLDIVTYGMAAGMTEVGERYEQGEFFLPQLVMAGATMEAGMAVLKPLLQDTAQGSKGTVVIGTVEGDMHDIGKNIVKTLLEAGGFAVHDLGINQPAESFVQKAREMNANIVAISALLTTTMDQMSKVIEAIEGADLRDQVHIMVGGAPVSRQFADQIGADGYAGDAVKAVREAERLMEDIAMR